MNRLAVAAPKPQSPDVSDTDTGAVAGARRNEHRKDQKRSARQPLPESSSLAKSSGVDLDQLRKHIRALITVEETEAPMLSCYIRREGSRLEVSGPFKHRIRALQSIVQESEREHFDDALSRLDLYLATQLQAMTQGVALFARSGASPFFLGLQFQVPLQNRLSMHSTPDIFPLVELKDSYDRYVVVIATEEKVRILEINLGAVTRELWTQQPQLRRRVGRQWTREHYQNHRRDRDARFLKEKINILDKLMSSGGHTHLILAGSPRVTGRIRNALPSHLLERLIDCVSASAQSATADVVAATLSTFIEHEQQAALDTVAELVGALRRGSLGAAGTAATLAALRHGEADVVVMAQSYTPTPAWRCHQCGWIGGAASWPVHCPDCASEELRSVNAKEAIAKLAERQSLEVEFVEHSDALMALGGVGCLLRYPAADPHPWTH